MYDLNEERGLFENKKGLPKKGDRRETYISKHVTSLNRNAVCSPSPHRMNIR